MYVLELEPLSAASFGSIFSRGFRVSFFVRVPWPCQSLSGGLGPMGLRMLSFPLPWETGLDTFCAVDVRACLTCVVF